GAERPAADRVGAPDHYVQRSRRLQPGHWPLLRSADGDSGRTLGPGRRPDARAVGVAPEPGHGVGRDATPPRRRGRMVLDLPGHPRPAGRGLSGMGGSVPDSRWGAAGFGTAAAVLHRPVGAGACGGARGAARDDRRRSVAVGRQRTAGAGRRGRQPPLRDRLDPVSPGPPRGAPRGSGGVVDPADARRRRSGRHHDAGGDAGSAKV
ncbi:MAG: hypothetical protein AVDCRST_MAG73-4033, partial [uncultured Thermomicrobiales bacterium]